jgi:hypothetical protein
LPPGNKLDTKTPQFDIYDALRICDLWNGLIIPNRKRITLHINNESVSLNEFPGEIIENVITNMLKSLKGVGNIESVDISIRKAGK